MRSLYEFRLLAVVLGTLGVFQPELVGAMRPDGPPSASTSADQPGIPTDDSKSTGSGTEAVCLLIPLYGEIGKEITAPGVRAALLHAKRSKIPQVILHYNTVGGSLEDGEAIGRQIAEHSKSMEIRAVISEAFSAAMWSIVECKDLWVLPNARTGAAVAFTKLQRADHSIAIDVDRKFNAALAARLGAQADANGYPGLLFRAMVEMPVEVWVQKTDVGVRFSESRPDGSGQIFCLDDARSVLALTATQMVDLQLAKRLGVTSDELKAGKSLTPFGKIVNGQKFMAQGAREVKAAATEVEKAERGIKAAAKLVVDQTNWVRLEINRARDADPSHNPVIYRISSGQLTAESKRQWQQATDRAIGFWRSVDKGAAEVQAAMNSLEAAVTGLNAARARHYRIRLVDDTPPVAEVPQIDGVLDVLTTRQGAQVEIKRLMDERDRNRL